MNTTSSTAPEVERRRVMMTLGLRDYDLPEHMWDGVLEYVLRGRETGCFLTRLLSGEFDLAAGCADTMNLLAMDRWKTFIVNCCPPACHGSAEVVAEWIRMGGVQGRGEDATPMVGTPAIADRHVFGPHSHPLPTKRPRPSILITLSADALRLQGNAERKLKTALAELVPGDLLADQITAALADLAISSKSIEALNAESMKAVL